MATFRAMPLFRGLMKPPAFDSVASQDLMKGRGDLVMRLSFAVALCCLSAIAFAADPAHASIRKNTNIPAEGLGTALEALAMDYNFQVLYRTELVNNLRTSGAVGSLTSDEALTKVLSGTGLSYKYLDASTVTIFPLAVTQSAAAAAQSTSQATGQDNSQEARKTSSHDFRVAQTDQTPAGPSTIEQSDAKTQPRPVELEEVVVTGSRLPGATKEGAQEVKIYTREQIEQSGQTTVSDFLNTLPDVSVSIGETGNQTVFGTTTVQLHGLPFGTTLVLINGRRVQASGAAASNGENFFDLDSLPVGLVERIEIVPEGSSAIYGSDAIAGVVNVILKKDFNDLEVDARYGWASGIDETNASLAWGKKWERGSFSVVGNFQSRTELLGTERALTATNDYTAFGGGNNNLPVCQPGNVFSVTGQPLPGAPAGSTATFAAATATTVSGRPTFADFNYGKLNTCDIFATQAFIPSLDRAGVFASGHFELTESVDLFTELMYSHTRVVSRGAGPNLFGENGFQVYTASASNPFNPFGEAVGVAYQFNDFGATKYPLTTDFLRPVLGARGTVFDSWHWEVAAWQSQDQEHYTQTNVLDPAAVQTALDSSDPTSALDVFTAGSPGSEQLLQSLIGQDVEILYASKARAVDAVLRGSVEGLPTGSIDVAVGSEYGRDTLYQNVIQEQPFFAPNTRTTYGRTRYAVFGEARIPLLAREQTSHGNDILAVTAAGRYDDFSDFGHKSTPQFGVEWRPLEALLIRGAYGRSFRAPSLSALYTPPISFQAAAPDPLRNNQIETFNVTTGGNPSLQPETGVSRSFGGVYSNSELAGLLLSVTWWNIKEDSAIQQLDYGTLIQNESLFPNYVTRASTCTGGAPCPIVDVNDTEVNYGQIDAAGLDYRVSFKINTNYGQWMPALSATQTYHYATAFAPDAPAIQRASIASDDGNWAPKWKGTISLGWNGRAYTPYTAAIDGRYVGRYQDYDSSREIGNFWLCDANLRYAIGRASAPRNWLAGTFLEAGAVNLFNRLPQFSDYQGGTEGFDPAQADLRGRFWYLRIGLTL
jgi:iron complex outermembrane recepter protein